MVVVVIDDNDDILSKATILVGLHPDECTEDIVDVALQYNKPFAIVPCCVFTGFFPLRVLPPRRRNEDDDNGQQQEQEQPRPVRTYEDFIEYLLLKNGNIQSHTLPFEGRNIVLYYKNTNIS